MNQRSFKIMLSVLASFLLFTSNVYSIAIDNGVVGKPSIMCTDETIHFAFVTQKPFQGRVYVKGRVDDANCREDFSHLNATNASYTIKLGQCGMQRLRSMEPLATNMLITVVVSFHSIFETKVDKAYRIQCTFQSGGGEQRVTQSLEVSMIPTTPLESASGSVGTCTYTIKRGAVDGPPLKFAMVGDKAVHVWECEGGENMNILIHSCVASDTGSRVTVPIVNEKGCSVDPILLENIQYDPKKTLAFASSHVYKYADQASIAFQCNIRFCVKGPECAAITPPSCPIKSQFVHRKRRSMKDSSNKSFNNRTVNGLYDRNVDVSTDELLVLPNVGDMATAVFETLSSLASKNSKQRKDAVTTDRMIDAFNSFNHNFDASFDKIADINDVCVPTTTFAVMVTSTLFAFVLSTLIGVIMFSKLVTRIWTERNAAKPKRVHYQKKNDIYKEVFVPYFNNTYR